MPFPIAPAIAAGASILGNAFNMASQNKTNRDNRNFAINMYNRQRQDALADFNMTNDYNSPSAQMARLRDAGLNPNLVYDNGATHTAPAVRSSDSPQGNSVAPKIDTRGFTDAGLAYYDIKLKEAQTDNLKTQNNVLIQDALNRTADTLQKGAQTASIHVKTQLDEALLKNADKLSDMSVDKMSADIKNTEASTQSSLSENERRTVMQSYNIATAVEAILRSRSDRATSEKQRAEIQARIRNLNQDSDLKQLDINLKRNGVQPGDNIIFRAASQILGGKSAKQIIKDLYDVPLSPVDSSGVGGATRYIKRRR